MVNCSRRDVHGADVARGHYALVTTLSDGKKTKSVRTPLQVCVASSTKTKRARNTQREPECDPCDVKGAL
jgi:hypothetical protein